MGRLDEIVERNQKALRQKPGLVHLGGDVLGDIFDKRQAPADRRRKITALAIAVAVVAAIAAVVVLKMRGRDEAPGGKVKSATGETIDLAKHWSERRVVVEFYPNKQLDYARERMAELEAARATLDADVVGVIGLTGTQAGNVAEQANVRYPVYGDHAFTVIPDWGIEFAAAGATPAATFVVEPGGEISYRKIGDFAPLSELPRKINAAR